MTEISSSNPIQLTSPNNNITTIPVTNNNNGSADLVKTPELSFPSNSIAFDRSMSSSPNFTSSMTSPPSTSVAPKEKPPPTRLTADSLKAKFDALTEKDSGRAKTRSFKYGIFDSCSAEPSFCLLATICPCLTYNAIFDDADVPEGEISPCVGHCVCSLVLCGHMYSARIRNKYRISHRITGDSCEDCLVMGCCQPLGITQMFAEKVHQAMLRKVKSQLKATSARGGNSRGGSRKVSDGNNRPQQQTMQSDTSIPTLATGSDAPAPILQIISE